MTRGDRIRVAVVGAGFISQYHIEGLRAADGAEVAMLVGRSRDKTEKRAEELGVARCSTDFRAVLADKHIDAVVVATPDATHLPLAVAALEAGKDVLLQKPMAMNSDEGRKIISVAQTTGSRLSVSFMHRYFPEIRWLGKQITDNSFGKVHAVRMRNATPGADWAEWFYDAQNVAGGVVMQLGVHGIDLLQHLFGPIQSLTAMLSTMKPDRELDDGRKVTMAFEDNVAACYRMASGFNATHEMSWTEVAGCDRFRLEVYFEAATVWLRTETAAVMINRGSAGNASGWQPVDLDDEPLGKAHHEHWLEVVRRNAPEDDTAQAGLSTLNIAEHIHRSAREGRTLPV